MIYDSPWKIFLILIFWVVPIGVAGMIGGNKGRRGLGYLLGLFLGWLGVVIIAVMPVTHEKLVQRERERLEVQHEAKP